MRGRQRGAGRAALEILEHDVGGGIEQDAQLIGLEPRVAGAADGEVVVEFLDAVLAFHASGNNRYLERTTTSLDGALMPEPRTARTRTK